MTYLYIAAKIWREILIGLLAFLLLLFMALLNSEKSKLIKSEAKHQTYVVNQDKLLAQAQANAAAKEKAMSEKLLMAERNYHVQIKQITADARAADLAADSLSKQLDQAKRRVPTATTKTVIEYIDTSSDVLKECAIEITTLAEAADAKRLSDSWPSLLSE